MTGEDYRFLDIIPDKAPAMTMGTAGAKPIVLFCALASEFNTVIARLGTGTHKTHARIPPYYRSYMKGKTKCACAGQCRAFCQHEACCYLIGEAEGSRRRHKSWAVLWIFCRNMSVLSLSNAGGCIYCVFVDIFRGNRTPILTYTATVYFRSTPTVPNTPFHRGSCCCG